jgi:hypothetical protein
MSIRRLIRPLGATAVFAALSAGPLQAQVPVTTRAPLAGDAIRMAPLTPGGWVVTINWGDGRNQTINAVTSVTSVHVSQPAPSGNRAAATPREESAQLVITFSADPNGSLAAWHASVVQGRPSSADMTLTKVASTGAVEQRCAYRSAMMTSWTVSATGDRPSYQARFSYASVQCTAG